MLRVIFDTSVYGKLVKEPNFENFIENIKKDKRFMIKGFEIIRRELRNTPNNLTFKNRKLRMLLLNLYDSIIKGKTIYQSEKISELAKKYFQAYKKYKGNFKWKEMKNDFEIISCASIHNIDIVSSDDKRTMLNKTSKRAYKEVNATEKHRNPELIDYEELKTKFFKKYET